MLTSEQNSVLMELDRAAKATGESIFMRVFNSMAKQAVFEGQSLREVVTLSEDTLHALVRDGHLNEVRPGFYQPVNERRF